MLLPFDLTPPHEEGCGPERLGPFTRSALSFFCDDLSSKRGQVFECSRVLVLVDVDCCRSNSFVFALKPVEAQGIVVGFAFVILDQESFFDLW